MVFYAENQLLADSRDWTNRKRLSPGKRASLIVKDSSNQFGFALEAVQQSVNYKHPATSLSSISVFFFFASAVGRLTNRAARKKKKKKEKKKLDSPWRRLNSQWIINTPPHPSPLFPCPLLQALLDVWPIEQQEKIWCTTYFPSQKQTWAFVFFPVVGENTCFAQSHTAPSWWHVSIDIIRKWLQSSLVLIKPRTTLCAGGNDMSEVEFHSYLPSPGCRQLPVLYFYPTVPFHFG